MYPILERFNRQLHIAPRCDRGDCRDFTGEAVVLLLVEKPLVLEPSFAKLGPDLEGPFGWDIELGRTRAQAKPMPAEFEEVQLDRDTGLSQRHREQKAVLGGNSSVGVGVGQNVGGVSFVTRALVRERLSINFSRGVFSPAAGSVREPECPNGVASAMTG